MTKKTSLLLAIVMVATLVLSACAQTATPAAAPTTAPTTAAPTTAAPTATTAAAPTTAPTTAAATATTAPTVAAPTATTAAATATSAPANVAKIKGCFVTDIGGIDDKSFNASAWAGMNTFQQQYGGEVKYIQSKQQTDYQKNLQAFVDEKCDLIISAGFLLGDQTKAAAEANPQNNFAIVDFSYDPPVPNIEGLTFQTDQAAFLAGYLAAGMTKTGKVGTYGGLQIPTVTIFEDGFYYGIQQYNKVHSTSVTLLGWDPVKQNGLFGGGFTDTAKGKEISTNLIQEGADIIMPVAGGMGEGTLAAIKDNGSGYVIGVDSDWVVKYADQSKIILTSVMKKIDVATYNAMMAVATGTFKGGQNYLGTLTNKGVDIAPYHDLASQVPQSLQDEINQLRDDIIAGKVSVNGK